MWLGVLQHGAMYTLLETAAQRDFRAECRSPKQREG